MVREDEHKKFHAFIDKHAIEKANTAEKKTYAIKIEDAAQHDRLKRQLINLVTATELIPRHYITSLVSQYDSFLGRLIHFVFSIKPEILNASEKTIPYTELIQFPDIDSARDYIIEKEVETVIRKSHPEQFRWLKEKLGTPFNEGLKSWPTFDLVK